MEKVEDRKQQDTESFFERAPSTFYILSSAKSKRGFTLVELLVSVFVFSIVMLIAVGSLLSMIDANRKAQALKSVVNNLAYALDSMSRSIRDGSIYHCGGPSYTTPADCAGGGTILAFEPYGGSLTDSTNQVIYCRGNSVTNICDSAGRSILRSTNGGASFLPMTAPEVVIERLMFYVVGSAQGDSIQPRVTMVLDGYAGTTTRVRTDIHLQTTLTQRLIDF